MTAPHLEPGQPQGPPPHQAPPGQPTLPAPYSPQPVYVIQQQLPTSGMAVASMVLAIIGLVSGCCSFGVPSILAVIFGHVALGETRSGRKSGHGMAVAGLVMGYVVMLPAILISVWVVLMGGIGAVSGGTTP
ncbi:DUF4190 domain-containing protein [Planosporangium flavigriseum]|uniref:DUF4190 domain-containing protein n=1 Tax=Planosporangium flavigriseum TaxID=373681 RepID=UPI00194DFDCB|nr:DUF4190 domain-containing protein [Planosporangium flavigriseum]